MSQHFYSRVTQLYNLMDLDHDNYIDRLEAQYCLTLCYNTVHNTQNNSVIDISDDREKHVMVEQQVQWLFDATNEINTITLEEFKLCYGNLLMNAYEEEVLQIDLDRAIHELDTNQSRLNAIALLNTAKLYYNNVTTQPNTNKQSILLDTLHSIEKQCSGPKQAKLISNYINDTLNNTTDITIQQFTQIYKYIITLQSIDIQQLAAQLATQT